MGEMNEVMETVTEEVMDEVMEVKPSFGEYALVGLVTTAAAFGIFEFGKRIILPAGKFVVKSVKGLSKKVTERGLEDFDEADDEDFDDFEEINEN